RGDRRPERRFPPDDLSGGGPGRWGNGPRCARWSTRRPASRAPVRNGRKPYGLHPVRLPRPESPSSGTPPRSPALRGGVRSAAGEDRRPGAGLLAVLPEAGERDELAAVGGDEHQPVAELAAHAGVLLVVLAGPGDQPGVVRPRRELLDPVAVHRLDRGHLTGPHVLDRGHRVVIGAAYGQQASAGREVGLLVGLVLVRRRGDGLARQVVVLPMRLRRALLPDQRP